MEIMKKPKIKILKRIVNYHAAVNETFLEPYEGCEATVFLFKSGRIDLLIDGMMFNRVQGQYCSQHNGWYYKVMKLLSPKQ